MGLHLQLRHGERVNRRERRCLVSLEDFTNQNVLTIFITGDDTQECPASLRDDRNNISELGQNTEVFCSTSVMTIRSCTKREQIAVIQALFPLISLDDSDLFRNLLA